MPSGDALVLVEDQRARADETHLAGDDVEQLRKLVQGGSPKPAPDAGHARIGGDLEQPLLGLVAIPQRVLQVLGVGDHGAELEHVEASAMAANAQLAEEDRTAAVELDGDCDRDHQRRHRQQPERCTHEIEASLDRGG